MTIDIVNGDNNVLVHPVTWRAEDSSARANHDRTLDILKPEFSRVVDRDIFDLTLERPHVLIEIHQRLIGRNGVDVHRHGVDGPPRPEVKNLPYLRDFMKTDFQREMYDLLDVSFQVGQAFYAPPGTPKATVAILRKAFAAMVKDPKTIASAKKRRVPMNSRTAAQIEAAIAKGFSASPAAVSGLAKMLGFDKARKKKKKKKG